MPHKPVLLLDIDGVVNHAERFSARYAKTFGVPLEKIAPFFTDRFGLCVTGRADLRQELPVVLTDWGWKGTVDELLQFWFEKEVFIDTKLVDLVNKLKKEGVHVCAASNQEVHRATYLLSQPVLKELFERSFLSCDLGVAKDDQLFFRKVLESLQVSPASVVFWDDDPVNIDTAKREGIEAYLYTTYENFEHIMLHTDI